MPSNLDVLVVDDSAPVRGYLARVLERAGNRVTSASSGEEAKAAWAEKAFDLILLDLLLPDTDGLELLAEVRKASREVCVVMVTGHAGIRSAIQAAQLGADGYLNKNDIVGSQESVHELLHQLDQSVSVRRGHKAQAELERMRADLYAMVSHDLRNPINAIQLAAGSMVEDFGPDEISSDAKVLAQAILTNAHSLLRQLNDFLDFSKLDAGMFRLELERADLIGLARSTVEQMQPLARKRGHALDFVTDVAGAAFARIDPARIQQVLANLVSNAIKYTVEPGALTVSVATRGRLHTVSVRDTGIGIPESDIASLFTRYGRGQDKQVSKIQGTGLGLLIVKQIVEAHEGRVFVTSEHGKGSTFSFELAADIGTPPPSGVMRRGPAESSRGDG
jgi:signal transduction histidine kinase